MATSRTDLKVYFENGKKPTEAEFHEFIDAFLHLDDNLTAFIGQMANVGEAQAGVVQNKYMSPFLVKTAIIALTTLSNIPGLQTDIQALINTSITSLIGSAPSSHATLGALYNDLVVINAALAAKSSDLNLNDPNILATAKAIYDLNNAKEPVFSKNTAFNKDFGYLANQVQPQHIVMTAIMIYFHATSSVIIIPQRGSHTTGVSATVQILSGNKRRITVNHNYINNNYAVLISSSSNSSTDITTEILEKTHVYSFTFQRDSTQSNHNVRYNLILIRN